jgi:hypothetical protein
LKENTKALSRFRDEKQNKIVNMSNDVAPANSAPPTVALVAYASEKTPQIPSGDVPADCPKCAQPMKLARVAPFKGYADIQDRTYECQKCGHSESWIASQNVPKVNGGEITHH